MKIGLDINASTGSASGLSVYTKNLAQALKENVPSDMQLSFYGENIKGPWNTLRRLWWENSELPALAAKDAIDILHVPAFAPPLFGRGKFKLVVTVHDLIGKLFPNQMGLPSRFYWGAWLPRAVKSADQIIADSEHTKKDLTEHLKIPESKVSIIYASGHEGFSSEVNQEELAKLRQRLGIQEKYFLFVGTIEPRKNLMKVLESFFAFMKHAPRDCRHQLVIVGSKNFGHGQAFKMLVNEFGMKLDDVIFTDYISHQDLNLLYSNTELFLFPSLYEGFGMPILEAMASGAPVLTSNTTSLPEVAGDAAILVNPENADEITQGMNEVSRNTALKQELIEKGKNQITKFSWKKSAEQVQQVYKKVMTCP